MKKIIYILLLLIAYNVSFAAPKVKDKVVMTIGKTKVMQSEFLNFYERNSKIESEVKPTFDDYVNMYVAYRLKVEEALSRGIDTTQTYKDELEMYRRQLVASFQDQEFWKDSLIREIAQRIKYEVRASHILLLVDKNAPDSVANAKMRQIEQYRQQVENGAPFDSLARAVTEDPSGKYNGGDLGYFKLMQMVYPFEDAAFTTPIGEMAICRTTYGVHLIKVHDRRQMSLDGLNPVIVKLIKEGPDEQMYAQLKAMVTNDEARLEKGKAITEERWPESGIVKTAEYLSLYKEYHDGLLLFDVSNKEVWEKANNDKEGLEAYFGQHRDKYKFDDVRFKGAFVECADDENLVSALRNIYDHNDMIEAANLVRSTIIPDTLLTPNPRQPRFHIINGLFRAGDNPAVDERLGVTAEKVIRQDMPVQMTFGKLLMQPETIDDVRNAVLADYQDELEKAFVERLKQKFAVKLNDKELARLKQEIGAK